MLRQCPHHGFLELHQINTFYNGLNEHEQDSLNAAAGGNLLSRTPRDALTIIENKLKVRYSRNKPDASKVSTTSSGSSSSTDARIDKLTDTVSNLVETFNKKMTTPATVKAVEETCVTCGGAHPYYECIATDSNTSSACAATGTYNQGVHQNRASNQMEPPEFPPVQSNNQNRFNQNQGNNNMLSCLMNNPSGSGSLPNNTIANPRGDLKAITTRSVVSYDGSPIPPPFSSLPKVVERVPEVTKDTVQPSTENVQPSVVQNQVPIDEPGIAPKLKPTIPYPSRVTKQKLHKKDDNLALKFVEIFKKLHFDLSFTDALLHMPKFALMFKSLLNNKEKLLDLATTPVNENCSAVILKKLPEKLGDPDKFLIPCDFSELDECLALADLGKFHFPTDFVIVDYVVDHRVPLILERLFLRIGRALIDVYGEELTLRIDDEAITFKVGQTSKYSYNDVASINRIDVIDVACEEYFQEATSFWKRSTSKSIPPGIINTDFDLEGDIRLIEKLLNDDPSSSPLPPKELNVEEIKTVKSSIDEPPELKLKELPSHLEYAFLEGTDKLPFIISKELKDEEKSALLKVLKCNAPLRKEDVMS
nr:reverse transcriptase domain-containing protein [Tanacetum cinerariifolium]